MMSAQVGGCGRREGRLLNAAGSKSIGRARRQRKFFSGWKPTKLLILTKSSDKMSMSEVWQSDGVFRWNHDALLGGRQK